MPKWTVSDDPEAFMIQACRHVKELAERYGDKIAMWDVINEEVHRVTVGSSDKRKEFTIDVTSDANARKPHRLVLN